jgi:hypothetical protein
LKRGLKLEEGQKLYYLDIQIAEVNGSHKEQKDDGFPWPPPRPAGDFIIWIYRLQRSMGLI